jgi:hypothetical protein
MKTNFHQKSIFNLKMKKKCFGLKIVEKQNFFIFFHSYIDPIGSNCQRIIVTWQTEKSKNTADGAYDFVSFLELPPEEKLEY